MRSRMPVWAFAFVVFSIFFSVSLVKLQHPGSDETDSHFPTMMNFYLNGIEATFNEDYSAANTPLPYVIVCVIAKIASPTVLTARVVTALFSFATFILLTELLVAHGTPPSRSLPFLFYPYFFMNSFVFYVVNFGLFFGLLGLLVLDRLGKETPVQFYLLAGMCFALAILCQQFYLVIPFAILAVKTTRAVPMIRGGLAGRTKGLLLQLSCLIVPLVLPLWLFVKWGGLTHHNFRGHTVGFHATTIVAILLVVGLYFAPYLLKVLKRATILEIVVAIFASVLLVAFARPGFSDDEQPGVFTGLTNHLISMFNHIHPAVSSVAFGVLVCAGLLVLMKLAADISSEWDMFAFASCIALGVAYAFNDKIGERHLLALVTLLFLLVLPRLEKAHERYYTFLMAMVGTGYFIYWVFLKFD